MNRIERIEHPILIVGVGRSGTTLLYDLLARHPDVAWFSSLTDRFPSALPLASLSFLYPRWDAGGTRPRWVPSPVEGYRLWHDPGTVDDGPLSADDATPQRAAHVTRIVAGHLRYQRKGRFLNKNTRHTRCIPYLEALFDDALFVHVLRDPRAVVASLLRVAFWPDLRIWSEGGVTPRRWVEGGGDAAELAASLWAADVRRARTDGAELPRDRYLEVRYEELADDPGGVLARVADFARLRPVPARTYLSGSKVASRNDRFRSELRPEQLRRIQGRVGEVARGCGYRSEVETA